MTDIFNNLDWSILTGALLSIIPALLCITIHELAHGLTAYRLGDNTAKDMGRLTLNPLKHIDIFGLIMMAVFRFGWAKPVPVNMRRFKHPKRYMAITALAGPVSNLIMAIVVLFIYGVTYEILGGVYSTGLKRVILDIIIRAAYLNVALAVFNLVPIPPLDGSKVLFSLISDEAYFKLMAYEKYGMILLIVFNSTKYFGMTVGQVTTSIFNGLRAVADFAYRMVN